MERLEHFGFRRRRRCRGGCLRRPKSIRDNEDDPNDDDSDEKEAEPPRSEETIEDGRNKRLNKKRV